MLFPVSGERKLMSLLTTLDLSRNLTPDVHEAFQGLEKTGIIDMGTESPFMRTLSEVVNRREEPPVEKKAPTNRETERPSRSEDPANPAVQTGKEKENDPESTRTSREEGSRTGPDGAVKKGEGKEGVSGEGTSITGRKKETRETREKSGQVSENEGKENAEKKDHVQNGSSGFFLSTLEILTARPEKKESAKTGNHREPTGEKAAARTIPEKKDTVSLLLQESGLSTHTKLSVKKEGELPASTKDQKKVPVAAEGEKKPSAGEDSQKGTVRVDLDPRVWNIRQERRAPLEGERQDNLSGDEKGEGEENQGVSRSSRRLHLEGKGGHQQGKRDSSGGEDAKGQNQELLNLFKNSSGQTQASRETGRSDAPDQARNPELFRGLVQKAKVNMDSKGNSSASINLRPEALGKLTMNLEMKGNVLEARLLVDSGSAKKAIMDELEHLKLELKNHGIQVESFQVRVRESSSSQFAFQHQQDRGDEQGAMQFSGNENGRSERKDQGQEGESFGSRRIGTGEEMSQEGLEIPGFERHESVVSRERINISI